MPSQETRHIDDSGREQSLSPALAGTLQTGTVLRGRYRIQGLLGVGGMGAVYQARDLNFPEVTRLCAIKEMINMASDPAMREATARNFQREANILALLSHPAIPEIYDYYMEGERAYLIIEYIIGKDLEALLNSTDAFLPVEQVRQWAIEICDVLDYLHSHKPDPVVFRDLKPSNVMIDQHRKVRLIDFGIAKNFQVGEKHTMIGTEGYSPPEQYRGEVSSRSDLYALGATLHHLLTRRDPRLEPPFSFESRPVEQFNDKVPQGMIDIINRALAYNAEDRFNTVAEMKAALEALAGSDRVVVVRDVGGGQTAIVEAGPGMGSDGNVVPIWSFKVEDEIRSSPAVDRGIVFVGSYDNNIWALDAKDGSMLWKFATDRGIGSSPEVVGGYVYIGSEDFKMYALDARSGRIQWSFDTGGKIICKPKVAVGHVFFGSDDSKFYAIKASNGRLHWSMNAEGPVRSSPFITDEMIYFGCEQGDFYAVDLSGDIKWRFKARRGIMSSPVARDGLVYFGSQDWTVYALDAETGFTVWRTRTKKPVISSPTLVGNKLYIGSADGFIYALDPMSGREIWKFETEGQVNSSPHVVGGILYCGSADGAVYALNAENGDLLWKFKTGGPIVSSPVSADSLVYIGSTDQHLYALKA